MAIAVPSEPWEIEADKAIIARRPSQSPVAEMTWAIQSQKKSLLPKACSIRP